jgi:hypothetical protein
MLLLTLIQNQKKKFLNIAKVRPVIFLDIEQMQAVLRNFK